MGLSRSPPPNVNTKGMPKLVWVDAYMQQKFARDEHNVWAPQGEEGDYGAGNHVISQGFNMRSGSQGSTTSAFRATMNPPRRVGHRHRQDTSRNKGETSLYNKVLPELEESEHGGFDPNTLFSPSINDCRHADIY